MSWTKKLEKKWSVTGGQVILILLVFALTGTSILFIKKPLLAWINPGPDNHWVFSTLYYIFIFPIYNLVLLIYGWLFGMFTFFWEKEKKMWKRISGVFSKV